MMFLGLAELTACPLLSSAGDHRFALGSGPDRVGDLSAEGWAAGRQRGRQGARGD